MRFVAVAAIIAFAFDVADAGCIVLTGVHYTFHGSGDSSSLQNRTAFNCGGRNFHAGGVGTYDDPLTFASDAKEYSRCEIIYSPYLKKYLRMEASCAQYSMLF